MTYGTKKRREQTGTEMERLTDGMSEEQIKAIRFAESHLVAVFNRQFDYGTHGCYGLRLALVNLVKAVK